ncbi:EthD family reductase [Amycolatopsis sp. NPDC051102]|uniref:EthD family reductase n=1 Tax=Amycolatopsis sp. NPDC051102 TaxID=3155163 RepID=UPI003425A3D9
MTATTDPATTPVRFVVLYATPSDIEAFERHYNDVHIPLAKQLPGLRRYTRSHEPAPLRGEPCYLVVMLDWDNMAALEAAFSSEIGRRTEEDATKLARYAPMRAMILQLGEV